MRGDIMTKVANNIMITDYQSLKARMRQVKKKRARRNFLQMQLENTITIKSSRMDGDIRGSGGVSQPTEKQGLKRAQLSDEFRRLDKELQELDAFLEAFADYDTEAYQFFVLHFIEGLSQNDAVLKLGIKRHRTQILKLSCLEFYNEIVNGIEDSFQILKSIEQRHIKDIPPDIAKDMRRFIKGELPIDDRSTFCQERNISEATFYRYINRLKSK